MGLLDEARNFGQSASNAVASNVSAPVDGIAWLLRKLGVNVGAPVGGSDWMAAQGLTKEVQPGAASVLGETAGLLSPTLAAAKAPQIARGLLQAGENARAPADVAIGMAGGQRGIVPVDFVKKSGGKATLPTDEVFSSAVANTRGAQITPDGLLLRVQRNQVPEQGLAESVRGGVFYLPEGAAQAKYYSTGKAGYGGSERIAGETLVQNPLFVKGATGGKAPEAAFDALNGKGAYQKMRNEALKAYGPYGSSVSARGALVDQFLDKYAPEMSGMGRYIAENSKQGNQLAFALQEAAAGSAARRAGHDAIVGYSKQKGGAPFLSELFDVRERQYPTKFGDFGIWE